MSIELHNINCHQNIERAEIESEWKQWDVCVHDLLTHYSPTPPKRSLDHLYVTHLTVDDSFALQRIFGVWTSVAQEKRSQCRNAQAWHQLAFIHSHAQLNIFDMKHTLVCSTTPRWHEEMQAVAGYGVEGGIVELLTLITRPENVEAEVNDGETQVRGAGTKLVLSLENFEIPGQQPPHRIRATVRESASRFYVKQGYVPSSVLISERTAVNTVHKNFPPEEHDKRNMWLFTSEVVETIRNFAKL